MNLPLRQWFGIGLGRFYQYAPRPISLNAVRGAANFDEELPAVCVVTPSFNQARYIGETVSSVLAQGYRNLHYVIQDAGSTDGTLAFLETLDRKDCEVHVEKDHGQADALNRGFARTQAEVMAYLNSDDVYLPGTLHAVCSFFADNPNVDVVYGNRLIVDEAGREVGRWILPGHDAAVMRSIDYIPQETLFWRRRVWNKVGASFDASLHFAMDWDIILRFMSAGAVMRHLPELFALFRVHTSQKTQASFHASGAREVTALRKRHAETGIRAFTAPIRHASYLMRHKQEDRSFAISHLGGRPS